MTNGKKGHQFLKATTDQHANDKTIAVLNWQQLLEAIWSVALTPSISIFFSSSENTPAQEA